jgi:hypothetical protein
MLSSLYAGYKRRNAALDAMTASPPSYFERPKFSLGNVTFEEVTEEQELREIHTHLFRRHALLDRVIRARELHRTRFYKFDLDYGHQKFIDQLKGQKFTVLRTLQRLEKRTAEVLYKKQKWYDWVQEMQEEEDKTRENESKKIERESKLFKGMRKEMMARMSKARAMENERRNDLALDEAFKKRMEQKEMERKLDISDDDQEWDPIEDVVEDQRGNYVDLISHFLWIKTPDIADRMENLVVQDAQSPPPPVPESTAFSTTIAKKNKSKKKKAIKEPTAIPSKKEMESRELMQQRLEVGCDFPAELMANYVTVGASGEEDIKDTEDYRLRVAPIPKGEVVILLQNVAEIKQLLFCRLLLGHATLLPAALKAESIEDLLQDPDVPTSELRDLCLKVSSPGLQEIRDACADLYRGNDEDVEEEEEEKQEESEKRWMFRKDNNKIPEVWKSKREKAKGAQKQMMGPPPEENQAIINFDSAPDESKLKGKKIRVKLCGKSIWNYASDRSMTRSGWLQFSVIAKDTNLYNAIELCRSWDEFFELTGLSHLDYFPAPNWASWR